MDPLIAETIMKGLSMSVEDRLSSITLFKEAIAQHRKTEKERQDEEDAKLRKKKNRKIIVGIATLALMFLITAVFCITHRKFVKFRGKETQEFVFYYGENMDSEDLDALKESINHKFDYLVGQENYIVDNEAGYIRITTLYAPFEERDIPSLLNKAFLLSYCRVGCYDKYGLFSTIARLESEDIVDAFGRDGVSTISIHGNVAEEISKLTDLGEELVLEIFTEGGENYLWDKHNHPNNVKQYDIPIKYDSERKQIMFDDDTPNSSLSKIILECLSEKFDKIESFNFERHITWETHQKTFWGKHQVDFEDLKSKYVLLTYSYDGFDENDGIILGKNVSEAEANSDIEKPDIVLLKNRLDSLNTPYACGWEKYNPLELIIAIDPDRIWEIEAAILFGQLSTWSMSFDSLNIGAFGTINIRSLSGVVLPAIDLSEPITTSNGNITVRIEDTYALGEILKRIKELGEDEIQLCIGNRPAFQTTLSNIDEDGYVTFVDPIIDNIDENKVKEQLAFFVAFLNSMAGETSINEYHFTGAIFVDAKGRIQWYKDLWEMNGCETSSMRTKIGEFANSLPDNSVIMEWKQNTPSVISITCYFEKLGDLYSHPYEIVKDLLQSIEWTNEVTDINFLIFAGENRNTWYYMDTDKNRINGKINFRWDINYWNNNEEYSDPEAHDRKVKEDKETTVKLLSSEDIFTENLLSPATSYFPSKAQVNNDNILLVVSAQNTLPGQDYCIEEYIENKTDKEMSVYLNAVSINNNMPVFTESVASLEPGETGTFKHEFSLDDFHYTNYDSFRNGIFRYRICLEDTETIEEIVIPDMVQNTPIFEYTRIPDYAWLVKDTEKYSIYSLGYGWTHKWFGPSSSMKNSHFIIVNKTERTLIFKVEKFSFNQIWNDVYIPEETIVLPYSTEFYVSSSSSYLIENPKEVTARICVGTEDYNGDYLQLETFDIDVGIKQATQQHGQ